jgi:hypothetical protein
MGNRPSCRSCRHCLPPSGSQLGWCQLRQLPIHPDLVAERWCPHWTVRPPRLPSLNSLAPAEAERYGREEQLSLAAVLAES